MEISLQEQKGYLVNIKEKVSSVKNIKQAIESDVPPLAKMRKETSEMLVLDYLQLVIYETNMMFGSNMQMSDKQVEILATRILEKYYFLKVSDIKIFFRSLETKKIFGQLSPNIILNELDTYFDERCEISATISQNESDQCKNAPIADSISDEILGKLKEIPGLSGTNNRKKDKEQHREARLRYLKDNSFGLNQNLNSQT